MILLKNTPLFSTLALIVLVSCNRLPETDFTWGPEDNPEAGSVIWFANKTPEASFYEWDFGDEAESTLDNPTHIFAEPGNYEVKLTAYNDAGGQVKSRTLSITSPTVLAFTVTDSTGNNPLVGAELRVYDNEADWEEANEPLLVGYTNSMGNVEFSNMEPIVYYIWAFLDETNGYWMSGGYTPALTLNEINSFLIPCEWFSYVEKKASFRYLIPTAKAFTRTP